MLTPQSAHASTRDDMDGAIKTLRESADAWAAMPITDLIGILKELTAGFGQVLDDWIAIGLDHKQAASVAYAVGIEWVAGPVPVLRYLNSLRRALLDIEAHGVPQFPGPLSKGPDGQVVARTYPRSLYERIVTPGVTAEVWMEPDVEPQSLAETQALSFRQPKPGSVALVLGAGNVGALPVVDSLHKLFVEKQVVLLKMNPVNEYLGPLIERAFGRLVAEGALRLAYGGAEQGSYLSTHPGIDELHVTGSDRTYDAVVFGLGAEGAQRKESGERLVTKRFTAELGGVGPMIVVPGPWSPSDIEYQAEQIVANCIDSASFSCSRARVIVTHEEWPLREALLRRTRELLSAVPPRVAFYPGAAGSQERFLSAHPEAETFGEPREGELPWALIGGLDPTDGQEMCFTTESFCPVMAETAIAAQGIPAFLDRAVDFANDTLWGTLAASIIAPPKSLSDPEVGAAVERAIADLRYGAVVLNGLPGLAWVITSVPWGSYPGNDAFDIQSGTGFANNALMFSRPEKVVVRAPFRMRPKPIWFYSRAEAFGRVSKKVALYELDPSPLRIPGIVAAAVR